MISILIVEDIPEMGKLLEYVIQGIDGLAVSGISRNTFEARLELTRRRPDLVLLDEILPGESGHDLLKDLNSQGIPVILITSLKDPSSHSLEGAIARVAKPGWDSLEEDRIRLKDVIFNYFHRINS